MEEILFEDQHILVVYKRAGLATQSGKVGQADLVSELKKHLYKQNGKAPYLGVIHRLDQPVEGLLVFTKNPKAAAALTNQLKKGDYHKSYLAIVCGKPSQEKEQLVDYLWKTPANIAEIVDKNHPNAKEAILEYEVLGQTEQLSLLRVQLTTGRFHQIRAQLSHRGNPLLADHKYGNQETESLAQTLGVRNVCLCASELQFAHPVTGEMMHFQMTPKGKGYELFTWQSCADALILDNM